MTTETENRARDEAEAQYQSIVAMLAALDDMEPFSAELEYQDWSARWEVYHSEDSDVLLRYARLILS